MGRGKQKGVLMCASQNQSGKFFMSRHVETTPPGMYRVYFRHEHLIVRNIEHNEAWLITYKGHRYRTIQWHQNAASYFVRKHIRCITSKRRCPSNQCFATPDNSKHKQMIDFSGLSEPFSEWPLDTPRRTASLITDGEIFGLYV